MRKLLFFHASWCSPCRYYHKLFIEPVEQAAEAGQVIPIDAWKKPQEAEKYHIDKLPSVVLLDGDEVYIQYRGYMDVNEIASWLRGV